MKPVRYFSLFVGIFLLATGILGFIPAFLSNPGMSAPVSDAAGYVDGLGPYGYLFGIFPTNATFNIVRMVFGGLGIAASISLDGARYYSGLLAVAYGLFAVLGLIPVTRTVFGIMPIFGADVILHAGTAALAAYFGFFAKPNLREIYNRQLGEDASS